MKTEIEIARESWGRVLSVLKATSGDMEKVKEAALQARHRFSEYDYCSLNGVPFIVVQIAGWILDYVGGRYCELDRIFGVVVDIIGEHFEEFVYTGDRTRRSFEELSSTYTQVHGCEIGKLIVLALSGHIFTDKLSMEIVGLCRLMVLRKRITDKLDEMCVQATNKLEREKQKAFENSPNSKMKDRLDPVFGKALDVLIERFNQDDIKTEDAIKIINGLSANIAKMRGELKEGTEINITQNKVFAQIMQSAKNDTAISAEKGLSVIDAEYRLQ